jgi:type IV secretory pathway VirD2 relaxase
MESDLGTRLGVGIAWEHRHPHLHPAVRGVADDGSDLVISRDYISYGLHSRARTWSRPSSASTPSMTSAPLAREVEAERWTRLDAAIRI